MPQHAPMYNKTMKGTTINDLGVGPEEIKKKIKSRATASTRLVDTQTNTFFRKKFNFPGKNKFISNISSTPPRSLMVVH